jgi:hypothetical protein
LACFKQLIIGKEISFIISFLKAYDGCTILLPNIEIESKYLARYQCLWAKKEKGKRRKGGPQPHNINMACNHTSKQPAEHFSELQWYVL